MQLRLEAFGQLNLKGYEENDALEVVVTIDGVEKTIVVQ